MAPGAVTSTSSLAAEAVEGYGVAPQDPVDVVLGEALVQHQVGHAAGLQGVAAAPVGGGVHQDPLRPVRAQDPHHAALVHLGVRIHREAQPAAAVLGLLHGRLVEVVDQDVVLGQRGLPDDVEGAAQTGELVAVRVCTSAGSPWAAASWSWAARAVSSAGVMES